MARKKQTDRSNITKAEATPPSFEIRHMLRGCPIR
jgi:hypothetical protein